MLEVVDVGEGYGTLARVLQEPLAPTKERESERQSERE